MTFNADRAATILVDAAYLGDAPASQKWDCTVQTIRNYRKRLNDDPAFFAIFDRKRRTAEGDWKHELGRALTTGIRKLALMLEQLEPNAETEPAQIEAVTSAVKVLSEIAITGEVLNAGNAQPHSGDPTQGRAIPAGRPTA